jgi:cellulose synthase operon protein C
MRRISRTLMAAIFVVLSSLAACVDNSESGLLASAESHFTKKEYGAAAIQLKALLQKNPSSAEGRLLLGRVLLNQGNAKDAGIEIAKALELRMPEARVLPVYAAALLAQQQYKKLIDQLATKNLDDKSAKVDLRTSVAAAYMALGDLDRSTSVIDEVLQTDARFAPALLTKARILATKREYPSALALVEQALTIDESSVDAWNLKGTLQKITHPEGNDAIVSFRKAYSIQSDSVFARAAAVTFFIEKNQIIEARSELQKLRAVIPATNPVRQFLDAHFAMLDGNYKLARETAELLLRRSPDDVRILLLAAAVEFQSGSSIQAEKYLNKILSAQPNNASARRQLAQVHMRTGQPDKALATLQPLLELPEPAAETLVLAAEAYLHNGDAARAESLFRRAAQAKPDDARIRVALALAELRKGHSEIAFAQLQSVASSDPGAYADMALISARLRRGELDAALVAVDKLAAKQPDQPLAMNLRGRIQLLRSDRAAARQSFLAALAVKPAYFPAAASLAAMDMQDKRPEDAAKRFQDVIKADPRNVRPYLALADLRSRQGATPPEVTQLLKSAVSASPLDAEPRVVLVNYYLDHGQIKQALAFAQESNSVLPDATEIIDALGRAQMKSGALRQAVTTFSKLTTLQPQSPTWHIRVAEALTATRDYEGAIRSYTQALAVDPGNVLAERGRITIALRQGKPDRAMKIAKEMQRRTPNDPAGFLFEADLHAEARNWSDAIPAYRNALKLVKSSDTIAVKLHAAYGAAGRHAEAAAFAAERLKNYPNDSSFRFYLGDYFTAKRDYAAAESKYQEVIALQPDNPWALNNIAWLMVKQNKKGAVDYATRALALSPDTAAIMDTLALALAAEGDLPKAIETQERAVSMSPDLSDLRLNLAKLYLKAKKKDMAMSELQRLAALGQKYSRQTEVGELSKLAARL